MRNKKGMINIKLPYYYNIDPKDIKPGDGFYCIRSYWEYEAEDNYCFKCGAKMDLEEEK